MTISYPLQGEQHTANVITCVSVNDDPDYPEPYWLWTLRFAIPIRLYDGSLLYQTFVRRFEPCKTEVQ